MSDAQAREGAAFLQALRQTGNVSMAVKAPGVQVTRKTLDFWRRRFPDFASGWDAAVSFAEAALAEQGVRRPEAEKGAALTQGGEYAVRATRGRRMQVRRSKPGLLTPAGKRTFLGHVAARPISRCRRGRRGSACRRSMRGGGDRRSSTRRWRRRCGRAMSGWSSHCWTPRYDPSGLTGAR